MTCCIGQNVQPKGKWTNEKVVEVENIRTGGRSEGRGKKAERFVDTRVESFVFCELSQNSKLNNEQRTIHFHGDYTQQFQYYPVPTEAAFIGKREEEKEVSQEEKFCC